MALVKMIRDYPEVAGGNTTAMIPEEAVQSAIDNGWRIAEKKAEEPKVKTEEKKPEIKVEPKKEETPKVEQKKEESKSSKK